MKKYILSIFMLVSVGMSGQNLIVNPGAESTLSTDWTIVSGYWTQGSEVTAHSGSKHFYAGAVSSGTDDGTVWEIYQDIDVSANAVPIDAGRYEFTFFGWLRSLSTSSVWGADEANIIVEYRDLTGSVLYTYSTGMKNLDSWTKFTDIKVAPVNTRIIRVRLQSKWNEGWLDDDQNDGYFDDLSLTGKQLPYSIGASGSTGPGGVGSIDGASDLVLWLDASTLTASDGSTVTTWSDISGYGYDFSSGNGATFKTGVANGYPTFRFNGSSDYFERAYTAGLGPNTFSIFSATKVTSSGNYKAVISNRDDPWGTSTAGFVLYSHPNNNNWEFWTGSSSEAWKVTTGATSTTGNWAGQTMEYQSGTNGKKLFINGDLDEDDSHPLTNNTSQPIRVGAGKNEDATPQYFFYGDISEIIMFKTVLNSAERIIVQNYLAAKYGYALSANDVYKQDDAGNGNYDHEVAGIGQFDASNIHDDAKGTGIVRINNPQGLGNNEFLMWGHDNGDLNATNTSDIPSPVVQRLDRVWRVSELSTTGAAVDVGNIDISFDLVTLGTVTANDLRLLIDTDNDGSFADETPIGGATSVGGGIYKFAGVTQIANNRRFTLGTINNVQTPLPVELLSFESNLIDNRYVELNWQTATETNSEYFEIEHSADGSNWEALGRIAAAGNSNSLFEYTFTDMIPFFGDNYYRLHQVDFDGKEEYFGPIYQRFANSDIITQLRIYPNPNTEGQLTIRTSSNMQYADVIEIYDIAGRLQKTITVCEEVNSIQINISDLKKGMYIIRYQNQDTQLTERLIIQ